MGRHRSLGFDGLEARQLLATAHHAVVPKVPIALNGTLTVDQEKSTETDDAFGDLLKLTPVHGELAGVGKVHGTWKAGMTGSGSLLTTDTIQLQDARGSFTVSFGTTNLGKPHPSGAGLSFATVAQHVEGGTKAYAHAAENGTITVNTDARSVVRSMTLSTTAPHP